MASYHCSACGKNFTVPDWLKGSLKCPSCRTSVGAEAPAAVQSATNEHNDKNQSPSPGSSVRGAERAHVERPCGGRCPEEEARGGVQNRLSGLPATIRKATLFGLWGMAGGLVGWGLGEFFIPSNPFYWTRQFLSLVVLTGCWFGMVGLAIAISLYIGHSYHLRRHFRVDRGLIFTAILGLLAGGVAGAVAQFAYAGIGPTEFLRVICWGVAGGLLGLMLSFRIPNLGCWRGLAGGLVGGLIGGSLFVAAMTFSQQVGRVAGLAAIGFCIGVMIVIVEAFFREAWLEVMYGPREVSTVSLGSTPVSLGAERCVVYLPGAAAVECQYFMKDGRIFYSKGAVGTAAEIKPGDRRMVGNVTITVRGAKAT